MWFGVITLFPEMLSAIQYGITGRAIKNRQIQVSTWNPRNYTNDKHQTVDAAPYGGGPGMLMMAEPLISAIKEAKAAAPTEAKVIYLSPQGKSFSQAAAANLAQHQSIILLAGRYEGIDERVIDSYVDEEWSIGDYVVSGGELPAMVMIDAITRLLPDTVGDKLSVSEDSLSNGLLKYPQYTRPEIAAGQKVPDVLLSGNHAEIKRWRQKQSLGKTWLRRPDLLASQQASPEDVGLLNEFIKEFNENTGN